MNIVKFKDELLTADSFVEVGQAIRKDPNEVEGYETGDRMVWTKVVDEVIDHEPTEADGEGWNVIEYIRSHNAIFSDEHYEAMRAADPQPEGLGRLVRIWDSTGGWRWCDRVVLFETPEWNFDGIFLINSQTSAGYHITPTEWKALPDEEREKYHMAFPVDLMGNVSTEPVMILVGDEGDYPYLLVSSVDITTPEPITITPETHEQASIFDLDTPRWGRTVTDVITYDEPLGYVYEWLPDSVFYMKGCSVEEIAGFFNTRYRNRYCYTINWNWIVSITTPMSDYLEMSQNPDICITGMVEGADLEDWIIPLEGFLPWMDNQLTSRIATNEQNKYNYLNEFTPDGDVTVEELRIFRRWLARILLANRPLIDMRKDSVSLTRMLTYYAQDLYDDVIKALSDMTPYMERKSLVIGNTVAQTYKSFLGTAALQFSSGCGCMGANTGVGLVNGAAACDPMQMYRNSIYNYMIAVFSDVNYWMEQTEICEEMIKYIDGILKVGFPLGSNVVNQYADCTCNTMDNNEQARLTGMLKNLRTSLEYIIRDEVTGNKNFINTSLNNWAVYLYENMMWVY